MWKFRPSSLSNPDDNVYVSPGSRSQLEELYKKDNYSAAQQDIRILPRMPPSCTGGKPIIRTGQWNINNAYYNCQQNHTNDIQRGILNTIEQADCDVIVLNEYRTVPNNSEIIFHKEIRETLGYSTVFVGTNDYPTAIATKLPVSQRKEIHLSEERSALMVRVQVTPSSVLVDGDNNDDNSDDNNWIWVIGTHLDFVVGAYRLEETRVLLDELDKMGLLDDSDSISKERIILVGDLNQQRQQDYHQKEWEMIKAGMIKRRSSQDDGVAKLLMERGNFVCAWDYGSNSNKEKSEDGQSSCDDSGYTDTENGGKTAATNRSTKKPPITNWDTKHPPATHWSGTIVDYSYGNQNVIPVAVSISPSGWSDHRMTICDWIW